jgi:hypothetical protein
LHSTLVGRWNRKTHNDRVAAASAYASVTSDEAAAPMSKLSWRPLCLATTAVGLAMTRGRGEAESLVFVVGDDASVRQAVTSLLQSVDLRVEAFGSAADFLKSGRAANGIAAACLILDVRLPGVSGLDF